MMCILHQRLNMICCYNTYTPIVAVKTYKHRHVIYKIRFKNLVFFVPFQNVSFVHSCTASVGDGLQTCIRVYSLGSWQFDCSGRFKRCIPFSYILLQLSSLYAPYMFIMLYIHFLSSFIR